METWTLKGLHLLERNQLIFIIALGEPILLLGGTMVGADLTGALFLTALIGFGLIVSMWWLYFVHFGLAYAHGIMVCGAIVVAVAVEVIVAHPVDALHLPRSLSLRWGR